MGFPGPFGAESSGAAAGMPIKSLKSLEDGGGRVVSWSRPFHGGKNIGINKQKMGRKHGKAMRKSWKKKKKTRDKTNQHNETRRTVGSGKFLEGEIVLEMECPTKKIGV